MAYPPLSDLRLAADRYRQLAKTLDALATDTPAPGRIASLLATLDQPLPDTSGLREALGNWVEEERSGARERLGKGLRALCEERKTELQVLSKDPLEIRLAPFSVRIDLEKGSAILCFSREELEDAPPTPEGIFMAHQAALGRLERDPWEPAVFHAQLRRAWMRMGTPDWVEITEVLAELTVLRQPKAWRYDPTPRNFEPYPRVQFLYDILRLRRDRALNQDGWRLGLGPATGNSAKDKKRVFWIEDERGNGQYYLSLRFVKEEPLDV